MADWFTGSNCPLDVIDLGDVDNRIGIWGVSSNEQWTRKPA
jgi:hypothetical protein